MDTQTLINIILILIIGGCALYVLAGILAYVKYRKIRKKLIEQDKEFFKDFL